MADKEKGTTALPKATKEEKPAPPPTVDLKEVAKQAGVTPREARVILRAAAARGDDKKRARWTFDPKEVANVVALIKKAKADKAKATADKKAAAAAEAAKPAAAAAK